MSIKVIFADDHEVVRRGIPALLDGTDIEVSATAKSGEELLSKANAEKFDVVLLDVRMGDEDGLLVLSNFRKAYPDLPVVMISTYDNPTYIARAIAYGAADYVMKGSSREDLTDALMRAAKSIDPPDTSSLKSVQTTMEKRKPVQGDPDIPLTDREQQVLRHIALGLSNKEIASSLQISVETVKEHVQNILRKLSVPDRTAAAVWAIREGMTDN
jgi:DNA-binding NarL/FixJ family response regulator